MTDAQKLKEIIEYCGIVGSKVLSHETKGEQYKNTLLQLLDIMKCISPEDIKAARYPANIESTMLMDRYLIDGTVTEEFDQLSLLSTLVTYVSCNSEGRPGHSAEYMNKVTALRKVIEEVYGTEAMRFCGSDGC
jgi:hypothetical protein